MYGQKNLIEKYNYLEITVGNTDFLILYSKDFHFKKSPWQSPPHYHLFCECHFLKNGSFKIDTDRESQIIQGDAFVVLPSRLRHSVEAVVDPAQRMNFYAVISENHENKQNTFECFKQIFLSENPFVLQNENLIFNQIMDLVKTENESDSLFELKLKHLFSLGLIELFEQTGKLQATANKKSNLRYKDEMLLKVENFMLQAFAPAATLEDLAEYLCLSTRQTNRLLKQVFNCTFHEMKNQKRLEKAKQLILETDLSLNDISEQTGYTSYTGFHKMFRLQTGMSPEEYRTKGKTK